MAATDILVPFMDTLIAAFVVACESKDNPEKQSLHKFQDSMYSVHWGINPPFLAKPPLKSTNCPSPPF